MAKPIIIDCDPGIDDAVALLLAFASPELDVRAVTVSFGNVGLEHTLHNALAISELAGSKVPVYAGADRPLLRDLIIADEWHGSTGLGSLTLPASAREVTPGRAVDVLIEAGMAGATIVAIGAMTNLALALRLEPRLASNAERFVLMAGSTDEGNTSPAAEFNALADPHALRIVVESGAPVTMFGLNATHQVLATADRVAAVRGLGGPVAEAAASLLDHFAGAYREFYGWPGAALHDPCTIAWLLDPSLFETSHLHVGVDTNEGPNLGRTTCDLRKLSGLPPNVDVAMTADAERIFALLTERLAAYR